MYSPAPSPDCSVVVPTYHEVDNLEPLCKRIQSGAGLSYEILVVDDDSADGSVEETKRICAEGVVVRIIVRKGERGLSSAVLRGFREAKGAVLVCMDADLSHPPEKLPELVAAIRTGEADFFIGSRYVAGGTTEQGWGLFRWVNSKVATVFARPFTKALDPMSGFFALSREQFSNADPLTPVCYKIGLELLVKCHCRRVREIPIHFANRTRGESKLSLREQWLYTKHIKRLADYRYGWLSYFSQFCFVGCTGMVVDLSIYTGLLWLTTGLPARLYVSRAMAIVVAMTWNFWLNRRLTFSYSRNGNLIMQYLRFASTCSVGAAVNWSVAVGLVKIVPFFFQHVLTAAVLGIAAGTLSNFFMSRRWVFAEPTAAVNRGDSI
jgi:dolichol-phosphate mannosyltransferase